LALFLVGQLALGLVIEHNHPEFIDAEYGRHFQLLRARQAEAPGRPLVLVLGSSRSAMGFRPQALTPLQAGTGPGPLVFNYSLISAGPLTELLCLERLAWRGIRPDAVLVEVWLPHLVMEHDLPYRLDRGVLLPDLRLAARYSHQPWSDYGRCLEGWLWPAHANRSALQREWLGWLRFRGPRDPEDVYWRTLDDLGWLPCPWNMRASGKYAAFVVKERAGYRPWLQRCQPAAAADGALRELLTLCRRRGIKVALLVMPEARNFRRYYSAGALAGLRSYLSKLCETYQVSCVDARNWVADDDFADGTHLAPRGATLFTKRLGKEFLAPWLGGGTPKSLVP
jgi:hypothetical protein